MLFERYHTENRKKSLKQRIKYFNFRSKIHLNHPVDLKLKHGWVALFTTLEHYTLEDGSDVLK